MYHKNKNRVDVIIFKIKKTEKNAILKIYNNSQHTIFIENINIYDKKIPTNLGTKFINLQKDFIIPSGIYDVFNFLINDKSDKLEIHYKYIVFNNKEYCGRLKCKTIKI